MTKTLIIGEPRSFPVYDKNTYKLLYWQLVYRTCDNIEETRYFRNTAFSRAYKKMCRFQTRFLRQQNENTK